MVQHIEVITGITEFPPTENGPVIKGSVSQGPDNQCNTPYNLKNLYGVPQNLFVTNRNATASIFAEGSVGNGEGFGAGAILFWESLLGLPAVR